MSNTTPSKALRRNAQIKSYKQLACRWPSPVTGLSGWPAASQTLLNPSVWVSDEFVGN